MVQPSLAVVSAENNRVKTPEVAPIGIIELFAGAGGLAQGFLRAEQFDLIALSDIDENARSVFSANYPAPTYIANDIAQLSPRQLKAAANGRKIAGLLGGPPCQGFSKAGLRDPEDKRNAYVEDYIRFVKALNPDFLLMENVPQILFSKQFKTLLNALSKRYEVCYAILNAALYGIPQTRHRAFVLAYHRRLGITPRFPLPTHGFIGQEIYNYQQKRLEVPVSGKSREDILGADPVVAKLPELLRSDSNEAQTTLPFVTVMDALSDLQGLANGQTVKNHPDYPQTDYQRMVRQNVGDVLHNHSARSHQPSMVQLIEAIPEGGDLNDVDQAFWPKSHFSQAYGRLHRQGLARTVTTFFCNPGSGRFVHPVDHRALTVREAARLQGFSDDFIFFGSQDQQMQLVGNAVPPPLAHAIANQVLADITATL